MTTAVLPAIPAAPTDTCVLWTGALMPNGYPRRGRVLVHREVLAAKLGRPIAAGMDTCHTCDVRHCINPEHLYEGSRSQNMVDCRERDRLNKPRGDEHWCTRVSDAEVLELRRLYYDCGWSGQELGRHFGIHPTYALGLARGTVPRATRKPRGES